VAVGGIPTGTLGSEGLGLVCVGEGMREMGGLGSGLQSGCGEGVGALDAGLVRTPATRLCWVRT